MEYWISSNNIQMGPYALRQLQHLWKKGELASDTYFYDHVGSQWLFLDALVGTMRGLFTAEEALVRLGQNRETGCLSIYSKDEAVHLFVEFGFVICAVGRNDQGELALAHALALEDSTYEWFHGARPPASNLRVNIPEYALKHSIARDVRIGSPSAPAKKQSTVSFPKVQEEKPEVKRNFHYVLITPSNPPRRLKLEKTTSVLGREDYCDIVLTDKQVSRKHCLLEVEDDYVMVKDLDSSNGVAINGLEVRNGILKPGDKLSLGDYSLILEKEKKKAPDLPH